VGFLAFDALVGLVIGLFGATVDVRLFGRRPWAWATPLAGLVISAVVMVVMSRALREVMVNAPLLPLAGFVGILAGVWLGLRVPSADSASNKRIERTV
jgi:predicted benzoate:H+ symporter BenE